MLSNSLTPSTMATNSPNVTICIDRGGTFTDCIGIIDSPDNSSAPRHVVVKLLSVDPRNYEDAPTEGIRRILEQIHPGKYPRDKPVNTSAIKLIRMGTTVATNALLERRGTPTALLISKGFKDLLYIGNQSRPKIFDLAIKCPEVLYDKVIEIDERVTLVGYTASSKGSKITIPADDGRFVKGATGEYVKIIQKPNLEHVRKQLDELLRQNIQSIAICFLHSYTYSQHEQEIAQLAKEMGFTNVSISSQVMPMIKIVPRGNSTVIDAYLTPCIQEYITKFYKGFDENIRKVRIEFMQSDGGLVNVNQFCGLRAILSGPAGGVVGYAKTSYDDSCEEGRTPVIGFDIGGTSTDVSRFAQNKYEHVFETITAGTTIQAPQLDINTVAAGGGSRLFFRNGMFVAGPESAGANPGPTCYRKGGPLTITDANLYLGRIVPEYFPHIFGPKENEALDVDATRKAFDAMANEVNTYLKSEGKSPLSNDEIAFGFITVINEGMCRPIRALTEAKGYDTANHVLAVFGGAGAQHACAIARSLGIRRIVVHKYASILSAYGLALANVVQEKMAPCAMDLNEGNMDAVRQKFADMETEVKKVLMQQGFDDSTIEIERYLNLRYHGTDCALMTLPEQTNKHPTKLSNVTADCFYSAFLEQYQTEFGFTLSDRHVIIDDIRIRAIGKSIQVEPASFYKELAVLDRKPIASTNIKPDLVKSVYFEGGRVSTPVYRLMELSPGIVVSGPAIIAGKNETIVVAPGADATISSEHVIIEILENLKKKVSIVKDPIMLSVFGHRFMSIAEQMGRALQKTAISTNIKERLDFSCALFSADGGLVANAPHIPVHLGSMQEAVRYQIRTLGDQLKDGDVILSNSPVAGGSHLPDMTLIQPVFEQGKIVFFVANRGHWSDIGGSHAGSMPSDSKNLFEEGAVVKSFFLVRKGKSFDTEGITKILLHDPAQYPGCSGTRCLRDNNSDLQAQVSANNRGIILVKELIKEYGLDVVQAYMNYIQEAAENSVRELLMNVVKTRGTNILKSKDFMDDGSPICLTITIDGSNGDAVFDFNGTGPEVYGNTNAPRSVTNSAIIYCLRCLVGLDIPLNQGALNPVTIKIPKNSLLDPSESAAVVGGNVLTSQRLCDVILKAFEAAADSQGCCNNFTFGIDADEDGEGFGYYETIAGGTGAIQNNPGRSGRQCHMTNTRITDPEILERRYPVILRTFGLRPNSGGEGEFRGGDGCVRELEFLEKMNVSILSERRVFPPNGLMGGGNGRVGLNLIIRQNPDGSKRVQNFGGKNSAVLEKGDIIRIETPGGGGWGKKGMKSDSRDTLSNKTDDVNVPYISSGSYQTYTLLQESV